MHQMSPDNYLDNKINKMLCQKPKWPHSVAVIQRVQNLGKRIPTETGTELPVLGIQRFVSRQRCGDRIEQI